MGTGNITRNLGPSKAYCVGVKWHVNPCGSFCVSLPETGRKEIEEIVEEMKERDREQRGTGMKVKKQKK